MTTRAGFSLLEVLLVLTLIALTTTLAAPSLRDRDHEPTWRDGLLSARRRSARTGQPISGFADSIGSFTVYPGGMIVTDSEPHIQFGPPSNAR